LESERYVASGKPDIGSSACWEQLRIDLGTWMTRRRYWWGWIRKPKVLGKNTELKWEILKNRPLCAWKVLIEWLKGRIWFHPFNISERCQNSHLLILNELSVISEGKSRIGLKRRKKLFTELCETLFTVAPTPKRFAVRESRFDRHCRSSTLTRKVETKGSHYQALFQDFITWISSRALPPSDCSTNFVSSYSTWSPPGNFVPSRNLFKDECKYAHGATCSTYFEVWILLAFREWIFEIFRICQSGKTNSCELQQESRNDLTYLRDFFYDDNRLSEIWTFSRVTSPSGRKNRDNSQSLHEHQIRLDANCCPRNINPEFSCDFIDEFRCR
jgi:hypothetical protein